LIWYYELTTSSPVSIFPITVRPGRGVLTKGIALLKVAKYYKLYVNGKHIAVGPTRSSPLIWYYDTLDIAPYLEKGQNEIRFVVVRYFATLRSAIPFVRTPLHRISFCPFSR
jgi:hypothetical protein